MPRKRAEDAKPPRKAAVSPRRPKVQVRYYQRLRELAGTSAENHFVDSNATVSDLLAAVIARHHGVVEFGSSLLIAINSEYAGRTDPLADGDIVDLMPPVSGG